MIVDRSNRIVDTGYNGPPRGFLKHSEWPFDTRCDQWCDRGKWGNTGEAPDPNYYDCPSLHAEQNALMFSDRRHREGGKIYVSSGVCGTCAKLIANSGLAEVVYAPRPEAVHRNSDKWVAFMEQCGLTVVEFTEERCPNCPHLKRDHTGAHESPTACGQCGCWGYA